MTREEAERSVGSTVTYQPHQWAPVEEGVVVRVGKHTVFVLFDGDKTPKSCAPENLTLVEVTA